MLIHDIQPDNMFFGLGKSVAMLNFMTTGLVYTKKIPVTHIMTTPQIVEVETEHYCDMRDYPEVCVECYENHIEGLNQYAEDTYRYG